MMRHHAADRRHAHVAHYSYRHGHGHYRQSYAYGQHRHGPAWAHYNYHHGRNAWARNDFRRHGWNHDRGGPPMYARYHHRHGGPQYAWGNYRHDGRFGFGSDRRFDGGRFADGRFNGDRFNGGPGPRFANRDFGSRGADHAAPDMANIQARLDQLDHRIDTLLHEISDLRLKQSHSNN